LANSLFAKTDRVEIKRRLLNGNVSVFMRPGFSAQMQLYEI